jgi:hypothetical protein
MPIPDGFQKAKLKIEGGDTLDVYFNPQEYSISKSNTWNYDKVTGNSLPPAQFAGGGPREMTLNLLLDVSLLDSQASVKDVTDKLFKMMEVPEGQTGGGAGAVPPFVTFQWGSVVPFKAVCTSLKVSYKLFRPNGLPIRADVALSLKQAETASTASSSGRNRGTNPTTRANAGHGVHTVKDGDSLPSIAYHTYGDATMWRAIADANAIENPLHLRRGSALSLPRLDV